MSRRTSAGRGFMRGWPDPCSPRSASRATSNTLAAQKNCTVPSLPTMSLLITPTRLTGSGIRLTTAPPATSALFNFQDGGENILNTGAHSLDLVRILPMAAAFTIPRFLLPQSGLIWRRANLGNRLRDSEVLIVRYASSVAKNAKGKPIVLEKPEKFNPPSHGARLPRKNRPQQQHYGGALSGEDVAAQRKRDYPGLPPPPNTWEHWFWNSRVLHLGITMVSRAARIPRRSGNTLLPFSRLIFSRAH